MERSRRVLPRLALALVGAPLAAWTAAACGPGAGAATHAGPPATAVPSTAPSARSAVAALATVWAAGQPVFGVFVPDERPRAERGRGAGERPAPLYTAAGAARLAANPLLDFVFLNLEGGYDPAAVEALVAGLRGDGSANAKALLVRIPPIDADGPEAARQRVGDAMAAGADGVVIPHVRDVAEARLAISFFEESGADVWSPSNPGGDRIAMLMVEDPGAVSVAGEIAGLDGFSILACGIGSLTRALGGDRAAAEEGNLAVLAEATEAGLLDMITASAEDVAERIEQGFRALLMSGAGADDAIRIGREAAGR